MKAWQFFELNGAVENCKKIKKANKQYIAYAGGISILRSETSISPHTKRLRKELKQLILSGFKNCLLVFAEFMARGMCSISMVDDTGF